MSGFLAVRAEARHLADDQILERQPPVQWGGSSPDQKPQQHGSTAGKTQRRNRQALMRIAGRRVEILPALTLLPNSGSGRSTETSNEEIQSALRCEPRGCRSQETGWEWKHGIE